MKSIVYYISGHGYGHATRSIEVIKRLLDFDPTLFVHIKSNAPPWLFRLQLGKVEGRFRYHSLTVDIGAIQRTSFFIDHAATYDAVAALLTRREQIVADEVAFCRTNGVSAVAADIPPLAFDISHAAGFPGIGLANFSWDWIYGPYVDKEPAFHDLIEDIRSSYRKCTELLRLPAHGDLSVFPEITDIPLIGRKAGRERETVREHLGLRREDDSKLVLLALRPGDLLDVDLAAITSHPSIQILTFGMDRRLPGSFDLLADALPYQELVHASDLVISKPGYGIVSECFVNRTPLLYIEREDFVECLILVKWMKENATCAHLPSGDFYGGNWLKHIIDLLKKPPRWRELPINGDKIAAGRILRHLDP